MRVAGIGFRAAAPLASLRAALAAAMNAAGAGAKPQALATLEGKARAPALAALAAELGLPVLAVARDDLARQATPTRSGRVRALFGAGSIAEAAALVAAGPGARLLSPRAVSGDGMATAALATSEAAEGEPT